jgi:hypothetical protein
VIVTDLTRAEADEALFADRTGELAGYDAVLLDSLMKEVNTGCEELQQMLTDLWEDNKPPDEPAAPEDFGEVDETIETAYCCPKCGYQWSGQPGGNDGIDDGPACDDSSPE